ncbi:hypothetical protein A9Q98_10640 [Thalassotalea sp. 42_200_T64]|nr:hypothetical protein A9Q98_10640 [Thalassotalea sp. 42_200_T64]
MFDFVDEVQGNLGLRRALSQHFYKQGSICEPAHIHITSGRREGLLVALIATKSVASSVAIESPSSFYFQALVKHFCKEVIEVPMQNDYLLELKLLDQAWHKHKFKTYLVNPNFNDPTGRVLSVQDKMNLIKWAVSRDVTLIEYDRGELFFGTQKPASLAS